MAKNDSAAADERDAAPAPARDNTDEASEPAETPAEEPATQDESPAYDDSDPLARAERSKVEGGKHF